ncbi:MAG: TonB-dependent receptor [Gammaproteobacteria bacterium]|nr:TonB-dependent receptor [Gammaproteobacteria bacterium]
MLKLTFGMRSSSVENDMTDGFSFPEGIEVDDDVTVTELGLAYFMNDSTRISVRLDENFRFAKVNELAFAAPGEILDTQTGESLEIGIAFTHGDQQFIATIYRLDLENEIDFDPINFVNVNLDDTRRDGLTLSWLSQFSRHFALKTEIGLIDSQFRSGSFEGKEIPGVSDTVAKLRGDQRINDLVTAYLEYHYSSPRYPSGDLANDLEKIDSISVYNGGVTYKNMDWEISFRVNNLFDETYAEFVNNFGAFFPNPERNYTLTAAYSFE